MKITSAVRQVTWRNRRRTRYHIDRSCRKDQYPKPTEDGVSRLKRAWANLPGVEFQREPLCHSWCMCDDQFYYSWNRDTRLGDAAVIITFTTFVAVGLARQQMTDPRPVVGIARGACNRKRNGFINNRDRYTPVGQCLYYRRHSPVEADNLWHRSFCDSLFDSFARIFFAIFLSQRRQYVRLFTRPTKPCN